MTDDNKITLRLASIVDERAPTVGYDISVAPTRARYRVVANDPVAPNCSDWIVFDGLGEEIAPFNSLSAALEAIVDVESEGR
jgi:hypothetical protein